MYVLRSAAPCLRRRSRACKTRHKICQRRSLRGAAPATSPLVSKTWCPTIASEVSWRRHVFPLFYLVPRFSFASLLSRFSFASLLSRFSFASLLSRLFRLPLYCSAFVFLSTVPLFVCLCQKSATHIQKPGRQLLPLIVPLQIRKNGAAVNRHRRCQYVR